MRKSIMAVITPPSSSYLKRECQWRRRYSNSALHFFISVICILAFSPSSSFAHIKRDEVIGIISGLQHPISGLDYVLAMIAVGLWGAQLGNPAMWVLPVTFPMVMQGIRLP